MHNSIRSRDYVAVRLFRPVGTVPIVPEVARVMGFANLGNLMSQSYVMQQSYFNIIFLRGSSPHVLDLTEYV